MTFLNNDRIKTTITKINTDAVPIHPSFYKIPQKNKVPSVLTIPPKVVQKAIEQPISPSQFSLLLEQYKTNPKTTSQLPAPQISTSYVPIPKSYKPSRTNTRHNLLHPMRLQNQFQS